MRDHADLPATHKFNPQVEWTIAAFTPQPQITIALWPMLISHPTEGRRLSWHGWLVTHRGGLPARRWSPIPVLTRLDTQRRSLTHRTPLPLYQTGTIVAHQLQTEEVQYTVISTAEIKCQLEAWTAQYTDVTSNINDNSSIFSLIQMH